MNGRMEPAIFEAAQIGSVDPQPCSPVQPPGWLGVAVRAPVRVEGGGAHATVPLCGFWRVESLAAGGALTGRLYVDGLPGRPGPVLVGLDDPLIEGEPGPAGPPLDSRLLQGATDGGWFCVDLARLVKLPAWPVTMTVRLELWDHLSEPVTILWAP